MKIKRVLGQNFHRNTIIEDENGKKWEIIQGLDKVNRYRPLKQ